MSDLSTENDLSIENVEETIDKAIKKYYSSGMIIDGIFWSRAIVLLKEKFERRIVEYAEECRRNSRSRISRIT